MMTLSLEQRRDRNARRRVKGQNVRIRIYPRICEQCQVDFLGWKPDARWCNKVCYARWIAQHRVTTKGWIRTTRGYIMLYRPGHPTASKAGYIMEHRYVMEQVLGRLLYPSEVVNHKNGVRDDNRVENLEVLTKMQHDKLRKPKYMVTCPACAHVFPLAG